MIERNQLNVLLNDMRDANIALIVRDGKPLLRSKEDTPDWVLERLQPYKQELRDVASLVAVFGECEIIEQEGDD